MKRITSFVLTLIMILSMFSTVSAATIADTTYYVPNPFELGLTVEVSARESGKNESYVSPNYELHGTYSGKGIDYKATLDMSPIRDLFDEGFMQTIFLSDREAQEEFNNAKVTSAIKVIIEYPNTANIKVDLNTAGVLDAGGIFDEVSRTVEGNKVTIEYNNNKIHTNSVLTAQELMANKETYLKDISFTLDDSVEYNAVGSHKVSVTLAGSTTIEFASKTQVVTYNGQASNMVIATDDILEHILEVVPAVPATCDEFGSTEGHRCRVHNSYDCGADGLLTPVPIPPLDHKDANGNSLKIYFPKVDASCIEDGMDEHWTCSLCKKDFESQESNTAKEHEDFILPKTGHSPSTLAGHPATCKEPGFTDGSICSVCSMILVPRTIIPATNLHVIVPIGSAKNATCTEDGKTAGEKCSVCNLVITPQLTIPATGHNFGEWVTVPATETSTGSKTRTCLNGCGTTEVVTIPILVHQHVIDDKMDVITKAPTCTETGLKDRYCACGERMERNVSVPAIGHKIEFVDEVAATCIEKGKIAHYTCVNGCNENFRDAQGKHKLKSITTKKDKSNHVQSAIITLARIEPTCQKDGLTEGRKCNACHTVLQKQEKIKKSDDDHSLQNVEAHPVSCEQTGMLAHVHCAVCNKDFVSMTDLTVLKEKDFVIPATGHDYGDAVINNGATPDEHGYYEATRTCLNDPSHTLSVKVPAETCQHKITASGHITDAVVLEIEKQPTCKEEGIGHKTCLLCNQIIEHNIKIDTLEHNYIRVPQVNSTCHKKGTKGHYKCSICDEIFDDEKAPVSDISKLELDKITEHKFIYHDADTDKCYHCGELVSVRKTDADGNDTDMFEVLKPSHIKQEDNDIEREDVIRDRKDVDNVESSIIIEERDESSNKLNEQINDKKPYETTEVETVSFELSVEKVITYQSGDVDIEVYKETEDFIEIKVNLPEYLQDGESYLVFRYDSTSDEYGIIMESDDKTKEYMVVSENKDYILLYLDKSSEYVIAAYSDNIPVPSTPSSSGGYTKYTLRFYANGGTPVDKMEVRHGKIITAPVSTREGYMLEGWYTENTFVNKFDFSNPITQNMNLYAKWVPVSAAMDCLKTKESGCPCYNFFDLDAHAWYHDGVHYVLENGIMIGVEVDKFAPFESVTRAMLVTMLWRTEGKPQAKKDATFKDLGEGLYYVDAIKWAAENDVVEGYSDAEFGPNDAITREQIATIMYRYAQYKGYDVSAKSDITSYKDYKKISGYALSAMQYAVGSDLMEGRTDTTLNPAEEATRAEMATVLYRFLTKNNK